MRIHSVFLFGLLASLFSIQAIAEDLALDWKPEPEFGGFYQAQESKLYEKAGLDIHILPGGAGQPVSQMVAAKKVTFGIAAADEVILARAQGEKIVALFAVYQQDPQGFMVHPARKFKSLKEVFQTDGIIALQKGLPYTLWLEKKYNPFKAKIVPYTGGIASFVQNPNFSQQCFVTSEPLAAKRANVPTKTFLISESGFNPYLAVVIAHEDTVKSNPDLVRKFVGATRAGWKDYLAKPETTNIVMQKLNPSLDLATFNEAANLQAAYIDTLETKRTGVGTMTKARWQMLYDQLVEINLVKSGLNADDFFVNISTLTSK
jgi:NitT/TauT family transport system substrate-binding protein